MRKEEKYCADITKTQIRAQKQERPIHSPGRSGRVVGTPKKFTKGNSPKTEDMMRNEAGARWQPYVGGVGTLLSGGTLRARGQNCN